MNADPALIGTIVLAAIGLGLFTVALRPLWLPLWRAFRAIQQFLEDWNGSPERHGHDRVPSIPERLATVEKRSRQLERNGGTHLADIVHRSEEKIDAAAGLAREAKAAASEASRLAGETAVTVARVHQHQQEHQEAADQRDADIASLAGSVENIHSVIDAGRKREAAYIASLHELGIPLEGPISPEVQMGDD